MTVLSTQERRRADERYTNRLLAVAGTAAAVLVAAGVYAIDHGALSGWWLW
ncbi:hypothetical protein [Micromonospora sp. NPDC049891]|uniref:hypothetical protein n=1 Tax=Micromonospora sp. NPDC049891 TaxID=3155655 RepID=UPI0033DB8FBF